MGEIIDLKAKVWKYYTFTRQEINGLLMAILAFAFIISFREWGTTQFDLGSGLFNFFNAVLIVALSILVHDAGQRLWGLAIGYKIEFKPWSYGIFFALIIAFVSNGRLWLIVPGGFMLHHLAGHRLGFFRYGVNYFGQAMVSLAGPLASLVLIIFLRMLGTIFASPLIEKAIIFNVIYMLTCLIPIPPLDGSKVYFGSRMLYAFAIPSLFIAAILMIVKINIILSLILSMLVGTILWIYYYVTFENKIWTGPK